jgi:hypothetical protein
MNIQARFVRACPFCTLKLPTGTNRKYAKMTVASTAPRTADSNPYRIAAITITTMKMSGSIGLPATWPITIESTAAVIPHSATPIAVSTMKTPRG